MITIIADPAVAHWVAAKMPAEEVLTGESFGACIAIGVAIGNRPVAGVVYSDYRHLPHGSDCRVTICAEPGSKWARKDVLKALFKYPFEQAQCGRITAVISEKNKHSIKFCEKLGFRKEGVLRRGYNGKTNALIFGLLKSECKYLV